MNSTVELRPRFWRRPWIGPLMLVALAFMAYSVPRYLTFDPANTNVPAPAGFGAHFWLLVAHVVFGSVAMTTCCFQIWPAFRTRYPRAHRAMGRLYVFGGVLPAGLLGITVGAVSPFGPVVRTGNVTLGAVWLIVTVVGFRMAVGRRTAEHRRWMIRSFALTFAIITTRVWSVVFAVAFFGDQLTQSAGPLDPTVQVFTGMGVWVGFMVNVLAAEWWLDRGTVSQRRARQERRARQLRVQ
ncbi:uncharacterized membrane protein YozB (DUF420 family) [Allocatelliglobosispora scoriae]|uniref:Uncharacterized membrane protein YozB (DUF420 family) n=1 Tax=Allocatelliglobosispora scoriae TaxID=643052 RepID=A0A841BLH9_9ACTN|nr:DUF2306 domain-containing protein [Allocatelliglobosispora scoriae]MBB5867602.1 uncharacterized membrane protein YozB (DUF420 family) [Allocatelliglobosispora scoriae]